MDQNNIRKQSSNEIFNRRTRNLDDHTLICCNVPTYVDENYLHMQSIIDFILQIDNIESCIKKIKNSDEHIFLVVSDQYAEKILPNIHQLYQLNSVFITGDTITRSEQWIKEYPKIQGIYNNFDQLQTDVQNTVNTFLEHNSAMPELFDSTKIERSINIFRGDVWLIKLFYVLIHQQPPDDSKQYFLNIFSDYYKDNTLKQQLLKNFYDTYDPSRAIWWYTKETFIYSVLNKALREKNIEIICAFHFFIQDLYKRIEYGHRLFNENGSPMFTYRGQIIHQMDIDRIKEACNLDLRLSTNSLLSTSFDRNVAIAFFSGFKPEGKLQCVLFEIECNTNLTSRPFADIGMESHFQDEHEVLFTPGTVFAVNSIELNESNQLYIIKLRLCDEQEILKGYHKKDMFRGDRDTVQELFVNMKSNSTVKDCSVLDQLYIYVTKLFPSDEIIEAEYLQAIASKKYANRDYESSIENYKKCLALKQKILSSEHQEIAELYRGIGESYFKLKDYNQTIEFCQKAIDSDLLFPLYAKQPHFYLGCSYLLRDPDINWNDISLAKYHFQRALNISLEHDMVDDHVTTDIYQALAYINDNYEDDWDSAIHNLTNALQICETNGWIDSYNQIKEDIERITMKIETEE